MLILRGTPIFRGKISNMYVLAPTIRKFSFFNVSASTYMFLFFAQNETGALKMKMYVLALTSLIYLFFSCWCEYIQVDSEGHPYI